jgi:hypothetical protein
MISKKRPSRRPRRPSTPPEWEQAIADCVDSARRVRAIHMAEDPNSILAKHLTPEITRKQYTLVLPTARQAYAMLQADGHTHEGGESSFDARRCRAMSLISSLSCTIENNTGIPAEVLTDDGCARLDEFYETLRKAN